MRVLLVGVGTVGEAIARMARDRDWCEAMVLADYDLDRATTLQGELGDLHDCDVWAEDLGAQLRAGDGLSGERRRAAVWLLGHFAEERAGHYVAALHLWHAWEGGDFAARLEACLEAAKESGAPAAEAEQAEA